MNTAAEVAFALLKEADSKGIALPKSADYDSKNKFVIFSVDTLEELTEWSKLLQAGIIDFSDLKQGRWIRTSRCDVVLHIEQQDAK